MLLLSFGFYYKKELGVFIYRFINQSQPCQKPITYSIVNLDPRFGLTQTELLAEINKSEKIWESAIGKQLFEYSPTGDIKINLIYDYRQKATDAMEKIGIVINNDRSTYDALKAKYDSLTASYDKKKIQLESLIAIYEIDKNAYEKDIKYYSQINISKSEYDALEERRINLNNQVEIINQTQDYLNGLVDNINSAKILINNLITTLNLQVDQYNTTGSSTSGMFNEGEYISDANGIKINIFQFNDKNQLVRVLAHELGHALGLEHIDNPKAIMYYLNEGVNEKLTTDDITALKKICEAK